MLYKSDNFCYRLIVSSLAGAILISLASGMTLSVMGKEIPQLFVVIGSNAAPSPVCSLLHLQKKNRLFLQRVCSNIPTTMA
ncbi:hypothetical protein [Microcoleus sp. herbarium12]|uniref:hypothetical protein n=1 Tax=Microcoleus sp. herbarium12 TaxID=3055437 RepID=UPI002FD19408